MPTFHIVLFNPEIPPNTGNIMRLCANSNCSLHIIEPMGFNIDEKAVRRAGLDYTKKIKTTIYKDVDNFIKKNNFKRFYLVSKYGKICYNTIKYQIGDCFIFGSESKGFTNELIQRFKHSKKIFIPMSSDSRSLNLSNAVAILIYEALRQTNFNFCKL